MKYIALTLGPITRTIDMAENTRGLWAASYLFSYLGKNIIEPFKDRFFLLPYIDDGMFAKGYNGGAGVFPDRYIFKSEENDFQILSNRVSNVLDKLAEKMCQVVNRKDKKEKESAFYNYFTKKAVLDYLKKYFKIYFFEKDFENKEESEIKSACETALAMLEQQDSFMVQEDDRDAILPRFFKKIPNSFLTEDAAMNRFKSIVEISSGDVTETYMEPYERYVAIVKADGDSMGAIFASKENAHKLSEALLEFNKQAAETISSYNAQSVYIGGDDLLFIAPIFSDKGSIFSLLQDLDSHFFDCIKKKGITGPTLSFGLSVTYYKYPMFEALDLSSKLLYKAKGYEVKESKKNNIVFAILKHSGQTRSALLHKGNTSTLEMFNNVILNYMRKTTSFKGSNTTEKKMLSSVMHEIREKEFLLTVAIRDEATLDNFFENNFNEVVHEDFKGFFEDVKNLMLAAYKEFSEDDKLQKLKHGFIAVSKNNADLTSEKAAIETAYNLLQFIHLVNKKIDERDENL